MSKKFSSPFEGNSVANALYDALMREVKGSLVFSLSFVGAGLIVLIIGLVNYFSITNSMIDSSEQYDAGAWLVIAGVGLAIGVIGVINILKSMVSLGTIGSSVKDARSVASPFQTQRLNRKVAVMNQSQSLKKPAMEGMAEDSGMSLRNKLKGKVSSPKNQAASELYDKYNPNKKSSQPKSPQPVAPSMEQKFDYGIHEEKKLTFADEFLMKNKRDPFAQYRKDLGMKEEPKIVYEQKPQFIVSSSNSQASQNQSINNLDLQLELPTSHQTEFDESFISNSIPSENNMPFMSNNVDEENATSNNMDQHNKNPYGERHQEDEGIFFSARTQSAVLTQQSQQKQPPAQLEQQQKSTQVSRANLTTGKYNFSLFDEIEPGKTKYLPVSEMADTRIDHRNSINNRPAVVQNYDSNGEVLKTESIKRKVEPLMVQTISDADESTEETLEFQNMFGSDGIDSDFYNNDFEDLNIQNQGKENLSVMEDISFITPSEPNTNNSYSSPSSVGYVENPVNIQAASSNNNADKYNFAALEEPPRETAPIQQEPEKKKSFSEAFLSKNKTKQQSNLGSNQNREICTNGTPAQRKFVDASEYDEWSCTQCGKVNQEYVGICACGSRKPRAKRY